MSALYRVTLKVGKTCQECGRKLDARMVDNPYGVWSIPTVVGGCTICGYCHALRSYEPRTTLPAGCKALEQIERWLKVKPRKAKGL